MALGHTEAELDIRPYAQPWKICLARKLRDEHGASSAWLAVRMRFSSASFIRKLLSENQGVRPFDKAGPRGTPTPHDLMITPSPAFPTPIADANAVATLLLSRGKYFIASKVDTTLMPDAGEAPFPCTYAGVVRDRTPDSLFFLVDIFGSANEFTTGEDIVVGQRLMSLHQLHKCTFYPDFGTMQAIAAEHSGFIDSLNID